MGSLWTEVVEVKAAGSGQIWFIFELELSEFAREYVWSVREREASRVMQGFSSEQLEKWS